MIKEENISTLSVEDLLGLLNSPQEEIVNAVRNLIKDQFSSVSDKWLVTGLMDYYFLTNSKRMLDLLLGAPEPHYKFFLEKISSGIKSGDRFRYVSILLYAVSRNPPPMLIYKIPNTIMKDLLDILSPTRESDMTVLVSGVMIVVLLLPALPFEFDKFLPKVFECFWKLVHWTPSREQDIALKPYLQVAVYSLFQRLYALYPCNLLGYLRANMVGQTKKSWLLSTLRPMLERVRLHPLLVSETKDTEVSKSRWVGLEPSDLIHECAKLCLDPLHEICEEMYFSNSSNRQSICESMSETSDFIVLCSSENSFWSPGAVQSPSTANTSVPHTPVYAYQLLNNQSTGIAESPPEAAVEATPETTPFTSPSPYMAPKLDPRMVTQRLPKLKTTPVGDFSQENRSPSTPLSPIKKEGLPFKFPLKQGQDILLKSEKSDILQTKLQEIQRERMVKQREGDILSTLTESLKTNDSMSYSHNIQQPSNECKENLEFKTEMNGGDNKKDLRKRKVAVYIPKTSEDVDVKNDSDLFCENKEAKEVCLEKMQRDADLSTVNESESLMDLNMKDSKEPATGNFEGLGLPSRHSMTELVKNVKTNRLRFLSQCGPPPNIPLLNDLGGNRKRSPNKVHKPFFLSLKQKSLSFPDLSNDRSYIFPSLMPKRDFTISSLTLSPVKPSIETSEAATQTEEVPIIDPYEQLQFLTMSMQSRSKEVKESRDKETLSPYELLDQFIEYGCKDSHLSTPQEAGWNSLSGSLNDVSRNHLRAMQCIMTLERYKREVHAERNRRLLSKIKRLNLLQEKDISLCKEKNALKDEMFSMHQTLLKLQEKNNCLEKKLNEMVEKRALHEAQEKQMNAVQQRDQLQKMCESLQKEKLCLTKELENSKNSSREYQRQIKILSRHSAENAVLRNQVEDLNKKILILGEIQLEMQQQMKNYKESQRQFRSQSLASEKAAFSQKILELEYHNKTEKTSLEAAMYRINELERKLAVQHTERLNHRQEIEATVTSWQERCNSLEKRNKDLCSINYTLEGQITQLLRFRPERENEAGAESRRLVAPTDRDGFPPSIDSEPSVHFPEVSPDSYIALMTSNEFRSIGSTNPNE